MVEFDTELRLLADEKCNENVDADAVASSSLTLLLLLGFFNWPITDCRVVEPLDQTGRDFRVEAACLAELSSQS